MSHIHRRRFLSGGLGALAAALLNPQAKAAQGEAATKVRSCICLFMHGGPSQIDTWDPKPGRETGGPFRAIESRVSGIRVSEHLPLLALRMQHLAVIRSLTSKEGNHDRARYLMHAGYAPAGGVKHPSVGSMIAETRSAGVLPGYVSIAGPGHGPGMLGAGFAPFVVQNPAVPVRNLKPAVGVDQTRFDRRLALWRASEARFAARHPGSQTQGHSKVVEQAVAMMRAKDAAAFELSREPASVHERYGQQSRFGLGCLMARRLVEAGVPFVEVALRGWDTHQDNFATVQKLSAELDAGMSALLDDLNDRGLLESTLVLLIGDFGRTPQINARGGRDHYPRVASAVLAGGGIRGGQVVGATDIDGYEIRDRPVTVPDLFRTVFHQLGADPEKTRMSAAGRPLTAVDGGNLISEII